MWVVSVIHDETNEVVLHETYNNEVVAMIKFNGWNNCRREEFTVSIKQKRIG